MSTTKTTTASNQYNPLAMSQFNAFQPMIQSAMQSNISNPWQMIGGDQQMQLNNLSNASYFGTQMGGNIHSMLSRGIGSMSPLLAGSINRTANNFSGATSSMYGNLLNNAANYRQSSIGSSMGYSPLVTGGSQTQSSGGFGQWAGLITAGLQMGAKAAMA